MILSPSCASLTRLECPYRQRQVRSSTKPGCKSTPTSCVSYTAAEESLGSSPKSVMESHNRIPTSHSWSRSRHCKTNWKQQGKMAMSFLPLMSASFPLNRTSYPNGLPFKTLSNTHADFTNTSSLSLWVLQAQREA